MNPVAFITERLKEGIPAFANFIDLPSGAKIDLATIHGVKELSIGTIAGVEGIAIFITPHDVAPVVLILPRQAVVPFAEKIVAEQIGALKPALGNA